MSLLLEALKKAEKAKDEPTPAPVAGGRSELSLEQEARPSERSRAHDDAEPDKFGTADKRSPERHAADQLFSAKRPPSRRGLLLAGGGVLLIAVLAGAAYVWYQISTPTGTLVASGPRTIAPPPSPPAPVPAATPAPSGSAPAPAAPDPQAAPAAAAPAPSPEAPGKTADASPREPRAAGREAPRRPAPAATPQKPREGVQFRRSAAAPAVDPDLAAGYQALSQGDPQSAHQSYERVLRNDPASRDGMLGLAAAEAMRGNTTEALRLYQRLLELDPRDPMANAGLVALRPPGDPAQAESRIKLLLVQHPDSATLHFTLGNLYAGQSRWAEAQQAYFRAYSLESSNADYAFNLAVSLDQINQRRLAADHYRRALALAGSGAAGFDRAQAQRRLQELEAQR